MGVPTPRLQGMSRTPLPGRAGRRNEPFTTTEARAKQPNNGTNHSRQPKRGPTNSKQGNNGTPERCWPQPAAPPLPHAPWSGERPTTSGPPKITPTGPGATPENTPKHASSPPEGALRTPQIDRYRCGTASQKSRKSPPGRVIPGVYRCRTASQRRWHTTHNRGIRVQNSVPEEMTHSGHRGIRFQNSVTHN